MVGDYTAKKRQKEWRERKREAGKKTLSVTIDKTLIDRLKDEKNKRKITLSEMAEIVISGFFEGMDKV